MTKFAPKFSCAISICLYNISMRIFRNLFLIAIVTLSIGFVVHSAEAQSGDVERFPGGFVIKGDFLRFPISNEIEVNGKRIQYFDRARFELAMNDKNARVQLANLGWILFDETHAIPANMPTTSPTCRYFPKRGHNVCYNFLQFYDANNGAVFFGEPISEVLMRDGRMVQYFENSRLEYRPNSGDQIIGLTNLGRLAMQKYYDPMPKFRSDIINTPDVQVKAYVSQALIPAKTDNTVFVVQSQAFKPYAGAKVHITTIFPNDKREFADIVTDADGIATLTVTGREMNPKEIVQIQVAVEAAQTKVSTNTYFRIWY
jgi:hypothetical protein